MKQMILEVETNVPQWRCIFPYPSIQGNQCTRNCGVAGHRQEFAAFIDPGPHRLLEGGPWDNVIPEPAGYRQGVWTFRY